MMKTKMNILGVLLLLGFPIFAQVVSPEVAQMVATNFIKSTRSLSIDTIREYNAITKPIGKDVQTPVMYAVSTDNSWVLVSADERSTPILAFSDVDAGVFPEEEDMPDGMLALLEWYEQQIQFLRDSTHEVTIHSSWQTNQSAAASGVIVDKLMQRNGQYVRWKQSSNMNNTKDINKSYNKYCPLTSDGTNSLAGCVAVAMGQIMWYWQWPMVDIIETDSGSIMLREYDWSIMPYVLQNSTPIQSVDMVAHLLHDLGVSVDMQYGTSSSSASPQKIPDALREFNYSTGDLIFRSQYPLDWLDMIKNNLNNGFPVLYGGANSNGAKHRFVVDGYDALNRFHINYGHGGAFNGFYMLDKIIEEEYTSYYLSQSAIFDVYPNYPTCTPVELSNEEVLDSVFVLQNSGEITISNKIIENGCKGLICSAESIRIIDSHIKNGSSVNIAIKDIPCTSESKSSAPQYIASRYSVSSTNNETSTDGDGVDDIESVEGVVIVSTAVYTVSGQLLQIVDGGLYSTSYLPNGMYILQHRMSDGSVKSEKIVHS